MAAIPEFETITYEEADGVATVTLNRPDVHNAFNSLMQRELHDCWRKLRRRDEVRCVVLLQTDRQWDGTSVSGQML